VSGSGSTGSSAGDPGAVDGALLEDEDEDDEEEDEEDDVRFRVGDWPVVVAELELCCPPPPLLPSSPLPSSEGSSPEPEPVSGSSSAGAVGSSACSGGL
jgi:hypothetical protein